MMCPMTAPPSEAALQRLAALVIKRRAELGMHKIDVVKAADITTNTYDRIESGKSSRATTYNKIEPILGWAPGSCLEILNGAASATPIEQSAVSGIAFSDIPALEGDMALAVQDAAIAVADGLTAKQIKELSQRAVVEFRRRRNEASGNDAN